MYTMVLEFYSPRIIESNRQALVNEMLREELDYQEMLEWRANIKKYKDFCYVHPRV